MGSLDDAELKLQARWGSDLHVSVTVVLHHKAQQLNVEVAAGGEIVGAGVRKDSAEGQGCRVKGCCDTNSRRSA